MFSFLVSVHLYLKNPITIINKFGKSDPFRLHHPLVRWVATPCNTFLNETVDIPSGEWVSSQSKMKWSIKTNHQSLLPSCFNLYTLYWLVCELHFVIESVSWLHHSPSTSPLIEAFQPTELLKCQLGLYLCFYRGEKKPSPKHPGIPHPLPHWPFLQPTVLQPIVDLLGVVWIHTQQHSVWWDISPQDHKPSSAALLDLGIWHKLKLCEAFTRAALILEIIRVYTSFLQIIFQVFSVMISFIWKTRVTVHQCIPICGYWYQPMKSPDSLPYESH